MVKADQQQSCVGSFFKQGHWPDKCRGSQEAGFGRRLRRVMSVPGIGELQLDGAQADVWFSSAQVCEPVARWEPCNKD